MTPCRRDDLVLLAFPFSSDVRSKQRPALVIVDPSDDDVLVARVTTQNYDSPFDVALQGWQTAGLLAPSIVRLHKLATIERALVRRKLGRLSASDSASVRQKLRQMLE